MKTWDFVTDQRIKLLHPNIQSKVKQFIIEAEKQGFKLRITAGLRTWLEQTKLYQKGRDKFGKIIQKLKHLVVTKAKAGQSFHNYALAIDIVEIKNGKALWNNPNWEKIGQLGERLGFEWGGRWKFKDRPHFQMTFGKTWKELSALYKAGKRKGEYVILT